MGAIARNRKKTAKIERGGRLEEMKARRVLEELWAIAGARATDYLEVKDGQLTVRDTADLPDSRAIASVERSTTGLKIKFYDKLRALELLGKHLGLFDGAAAREQEDNNLLEAIVAAASQEVSVHDLPELQQAAAAGDDLVEQTGAL